MLLLIAMFMLKTFVSTRIERLKKKSKNVLDREVKKKDCNAKRRLRRILNESRSYDVKRQSFYSTRLFLSH